MHTDPVHIWTPSAVEAGLNGGRTRTLRFDVTVSEDALTAFAESREIARAGVGDFVALAVHEYARELLTGARG